MFNKWQLSSSYWHHFSVLWPSTGLMIRSFCGLSWNSHHVSNRSHFCLEDFHVPVFWWEGVGTLENYWWGLRTYLSFPGLLTQSHILNKPCRCIAKGNGRNITVALKIWIFTDLQLHPSQTCLGSKSRNCLNKEKYFHSVASSPPLWGCSSLDLSFLILALALCCHLFTWVTKWTKSMSQKFFRKKGRGKHSTYLCSW